MFEYASDEKIAFCFKLWIKEILEDESSAISRTIINYAFNEILNGDYCTEAEFLDKERISQELLEQIRKEYEKT